MQVGVGYAKREICDGQSLASPGRWAPGSRVYPNSTHWNRISSVYRRFTEHHSTEELLVSLAIGRGDKCPLPPADAAGLKEELIKVAADCGFHLNRKFGDRVDIRFLDMLLRLADGLGEYSQGVRVGPGKRCQDCQHFTDRSENGDWHPNTTHWVSWSKLQIPEGSGAVITRPWKLSQTRSWKLCVIMPLGVNSWF